MSDPAGIAQTLADPQLDVRVLPNGLRVLISPMPQTRSATVSFFLGAGARYETDALSGISHLVEHLCFKGSRLWPTARAISEAIEGVGGILNAGTDRELTVYYAKVPSHQINLALGIVTDVVLHPRFDPVEMEKERQVILEELAMIEDSPGQLAEVLLDGMLWPDQPLGRDVAGTPASVRAIPHADTVAYRHAQYTPANAVVSVAGAVDADAVVAQLTDLTADWDAGTPAAWRPAQHSTTPGPEVQLRTKPTEQANLMIGLPGLPAEDPDSYALSLLSGVLGDGMASRLFLLLREDLGIAYDVHTYTANLRDTGVFAVYLGVDPDKAEGALEATLGELRRARTGIPAAELERVREYAKGRMLLSMEDTHAVSSWYGTQALLRNEIRSLDDVVAHLDAVTPDDVDRVAQQVLRDDRLRLAVVGPYEDTRGFATVLATPERAPTP